MSENRIRIEKQLGKSINPNSIIKTNNVNEPEYLEIAGVDKYFGTDASGNAGVFDLPVVGIIPNTYAELTALIASNSLIPDRIYMMIDYQTIYDQLDFDNSGNLKPTLNLKVGTLEPILLLATSQNTFAKDVWSTVYPKDKLEYDLFVNTTFYSGSPCKGRITKRIDEWENRTDYDHRTVLFIRYDDGTGIYNVINDNGNSFQEFLTFGAGYNNGVPAAGNIIDGVYHLKDVFGIEFPNIVLNSTSQSAILNTFKSICLLITSQDGLNTSYFNEANTNITLGEGCHNLRFGLGNEHIIVGNNCENLTLLQTNVNIEFKNNCSFIELDNNNENLVFGEGYLDIKVDSFNSNNLFDLSNPMRSSRFSSNIQNKDFTAETYMYNIPYEVKVALASDGNVYSRYFNGSTDVINLIP